jgi:hypothetical protein
MGHKKLENQIFEFHEDLLMFIIKTRDLFEQKVMDTLAKLSDKSNTLEQKSGETAFLF